MTADLHTDHISRVIRRRATDAIAPLPPDEAEAAEERIAAEEREQRDRRKNVGWSARGANVEIGGPKWARPVDAPRRRADLDEMMRKRGDGSLDIIKVTDEEAAILGLRSPTWRMRFRAWLRRLNEWLR